MHTFMETIASEEAKPLYIKSHQMKIKKIQKHSNQFGADGIQVQKKNIKKSTAVNLYLENTMAAELQRKNKTKQSACI